MTWLKIHVLWFVLYSVVGWVWEVIVCSVPAKKFVNRGFLNGPYCPIYGFGGLLVITLLGGIENPFLLFLAGAVLTCTLEYITSWAMEKLFHARWWDYSNQFLNINGRVCLMGAVAFGALSVIVMKLVHPFVASITTEIPEPALSIITAAALVFLLADVIYTVTRFSGFEKKLRETTEKLGLAIAAANEQRRERLDKLQGSEVYAKLTGPYQEIIKRMNAQERRLLKAFPKLRSNRYDETLQKIKGLLLGKGDDREIENENDLP